MPPLVALADIRASLGGVLPEALLTGGLAAALLLSLVRAAWAARLAPALAVAVLAAAAAALRVQPDRAAFFQQMLVTDAPARAGGLLVAGAGILFCILTALSPRPAGRARAAGPQYALVLALVLGGFLLMRTVHGIVLVLAVELLSLPGYALVLTRRTDARAARAALNYVLLGAVSTGALLYGLSLLYGLTGTLHFASAEFWDHLGQAPAPAVGLALGLGLVGLLFKLGAAPLHFWAPDAYQAAPLPVALLLSTAPKIAAAIVLWRLHDAATLLLPAPLAHAVGVFFGAAALLSLAVGTLGALTQPDVRRLLAYSSIAQAGFLLLAIHGAGAAGAEPVLLYAAYLLFANGAVFAGIAGFEQYLSPAADPEAPPATPRYAGLGRRFPLAAVALTLGLVALTGLPPTVGFSAKLLAFTALWQTDASVLGRTLLGAGLAATVAGLFFYLRLPYWLFLREAPATAAERPAPPSALALLAAVLAGLTVLAFLRADWLLAAL